MRKKILVFSFLISTMLFLGCSSNEQKNVASVKQPVKSETVKSTDSKKATQDLFRSLRNYDLNMAKKAVEAGADINFLDSSGNTILLAAIQAKDINYDFLDYILSLNPDLYAENKSELSPGNIIRGRNAGMLTDDAKIIKMLSDKGFDFNKPNSQGLYPLTLAINSKNLSTIQAILEAGADTNIKDKKGYPPITLAVFAKNINLIYLLINEGANVNLTDSKGNPPILYATTEEIINAFIENGTDLYFETSENKIVGNEVLMNAIDNNYSNIVSKIIDLGFNLNFIDSYGDTPINLAVKKSNLNLVNLLLQKGANPSVKGSDGYNALEIAEKNKNSKIIQAIKNKK